MASLFATVAREGNARDSIDTMISVVHPQNGAEVASLGDSSCTFAVTGQLASQMLAEQDGFRLAYAGEFAELRSLRERVTQLDPAMRAPRSTAELLLSAYRALGVTALEGLNGLYVILVWDAREQQLFIISDRYGFRRLYYSWLRDGLFICTHLKGLLALPLLPKTIDEEAVAQFLRMTFFVEERTLFERVKRVPPATHGVYAHGRLRLLSYGGLRFGDPDSKHTRADVLAETAERLKAAVERCLREDTALLLTGGLDSRSIIGAARQLGMPLNFFGATIGHEPCHDISYGRRIAAAVGIKHETIEIGPAYLGDYGVEAARRMEGSVSLHGCWHVAADQLAKLNARHVMTGSITTGVRSADNRLQTLPRKYLWWHRHEGAIRYEFEHHMAGGFKDEEMMDILRPGSSDQLVHCAYEAIKRRFHAAPTDWVPSKVDYATMLEYERRYIAVNFDMLEPHFGVLVPFLDNDLLDYTWDTKPAFPLSGTEFKEMIVRHFPEVATLPQTHAWVPLKASPIRTKATRGLMKIYYKGLPTLTAGAFQPHDYGAYAHHNEWLRTGSRAFTERILGTTELLEGLVNMDTVRKSVAEHMSGKADSYNKICLLLSLALFRAETLGLSGPVEVLD